MQYFNIPIEIVEVMCKAAKMDKIERRCTSKKFNVRIFSDSIRKEVLHFYFLMILLNTNDDNAAKKHPTIQNVGKTLFF